MKVPTSGKCGLWPSKVLYGLRSWTQFSFTMNKLLTVLCIPALVLGSLSHCTYGEMSDGQQEQEALTNFVLNSTRGTLDLQLQFTDGGTDNIQQFVTGAGTISLSSLNIEISQIDLIYEPGFFQGILSQLLYMHRRSSLYAHGEEDLTTGDPVFITHGGSFALKGADGTDPGGRRYQSMNLNREVSPGKIKSLRIHFSGVTVAGTDDGSPFSTKMNQEMDLTLVLNCQDVLQAGSSLPRYVRMNFSMLFSSGTGEQDIVAGLQNPGFAQEAQCFSF